MACSVETTRSVHDAVVLRELDQGPVPTTIGNRLPHVAHHNQPLQHLADTHTGGGVSWTQHEPPPPPPPPRTACTPSVCETRGLSGGILTLRRVAYELNGTARTAACKLNDVAHTVVGLELLLRSLRYHKLGNSLQGDQAATRTDRQVNIVRQPPTVGHHHNTRGIPKEQQNNNDERSTQQHAVTPKARFSS